MTDSNDADVGDVRNWVFDWQPKIRKPQVHYSALDLLWRCGIAFEFRYLKRMRLPPTSPLHVGRGVDHAANINLQHKIDTDALLTTEHVLDLARDRTRESFEDSGVTLAPDEPTEIAARDMAVDKAVRLTKLHATQLAPKLKPKAVQKSFALEIQNFSFDVVGTRDLDDIDGAVHDLKTARKSPSKHAAAQSDQGTLYALSAWVIDKRAAPITFALDTLVDLKRETKLVTQSSTRNEADFAVMAKRIENAERIILSGAFTPARQTDWFCDLRYCEFAKICPYFRRPVTVAVPNGGFDDE